MARRGIRVMLWMFIVITAAMTAYFFWMDETAIQREAGAAQAFAASANAASSAVLEMRGAQQAYVATGQGDDFWASKVAGSLAAARQALGGMRSATSPETHSAIQSALATLQDFEQMDGRAREYLDSGQHLLASDIIFSDGLEMTRSVLADLDRARAAEQQALDASMRAERRSQWITLAAGALTLCLLPLLLIPLPRARSEGVAAAATPAVETKPSREALDLRITPERAVRRRDPPARSPAAPEPTATQPQTVDMAGVASLCNELARLTDTRGLPSLLERVAGLLDAAGLVVWVTDPDGRELAPVLTHGYPPRIVTRLGTIPRDAENVTAAAFRTGLLQTVKADSVSGGAIAAPLVTPSGCVGVMAAEVRHGGEQQQARRAAAAILAAQLATLVGPPAARPAKVEAAGGSSAV